MIGLVNNTEIWTERQSDWNGLFSVPAEEGSLLLIACLDASGNLTKEIYLFTNQNWKRGDPNQDGEINAADALLVSLALGRANSVECGAAGGYGC